MFVRLCKGCNIPVPKNNRLWDAWSLLHVLTGALLAWIMNPAVALALTVLYEPIEIFILCPLCYRRGGFVFGNETWRNSLMDIVFNALGILIGFFVFRGIIPPPFDLFPHLLGF